MSWLNASDYLVMDVAARDRAEELLETSALTFAEACPADTVVPEGSGPRPARVRSHPATGSCCVSHAAA